MKTMSLIKPLLKLVSSGCNRHRDPKNKSVCTSMYVWMDVKPNMPFTMSDPTLVYLFSIS